MEHSSKPHPQATLLQELPSVLLARMGSLLAIRDHTSGCTPQPHHCFSSIPGGLALHPTHPLGTPCWPPWPLCVLSVHAVLPTGTRELWFCLWTEVHVWAHRQDSGSSYPAANHSHLPGPLCSYLENRDSGVTLKLSGGQGLPGHGRPPMVLSLLFSPSLGPKPLPSLLMSGPQQS